MTKVNERLFLNIKTNLNKDIIQYKKRSGFFYSQSLEAFKIDFEAISRIDYIRKNQLNKEYRVLSSNFLFKDDHF